MAGQKQIGWKKLVATALLSVLFLAGGLLNFVPKASAATNYTWTSAKNIHVTGFSASVPANVPSSFDFTCTNSGGTYACKYPPGGAGCDFTISFANDSSSGTLHVPTTFSSRLATCSGSSTSTIQIGGTAPSDFGGGGGGGGGGGTPDPELQCGTVGFSLDWLMCPMTFAITKMVDGLDNLILKMLNVDQAAIFDTSPGSTGQSYFKAWQTFRSFAIAVLFIAALTMIIAQGLGMEVLDAYTLKKVLPRLIVAMIGIALSWYLMEFMVAFTNAVGFGIRSVIYSPFADLLKNNPLQLDNTASFAVLLITSTAIIALTLVGLLSFAVTALLAIVVAFLVLVIRQMVIVVLILFSPIAIACYVLPNTQGVWKLWHESFTKALLMFPIIMAFLAVGRVFAIISMSGASGAGAPSAIEQLIGFAAYFLPYFLIPLTFRFAGGAMRTLGGAVNDRSRGGFDRLKKFRGAKAAESMAKMKEGTRYRPTNSLARGFNSMTRNTAMASRAGVNPWQMKSRYNSARTEKALAEMEDVRKQPSFIAGSQDDRILRAAQFGKGAAGIRDHLRNNEGITDVALLENMAGTAERMQASGSRDAVQAAISLQRFATGTGYNRKWKDENGIEHEEFSYDDAFSSLHGASGGDRAMAGALLGQAKGLAMQSGQVAFGGASYGTLSEGLTEKFKGEAVSERTASKIALDAYDSTDAATAARARGVHLQTMANAATQRIVDLDNGNAREPKPGELGARTAQLESWSQTVGLYGAPNRQGIVNDTLPVAEGPMSKFRPASPPAANGQEPLIVVPRWRPELADPNTPLPRLATPATPTPAVSRDDAIHYERNARGSRVSPNDPRIRDQQQPPEDRK